MVGGGLKMTLHLTIRWIQERIQKVLVGVHVILNQVEC